MASYSLIGHFFGELAPYYFYRTVEKPKPLFDTSSGSLLNWVVGLELHLIIAFGCYLLFGVPVFRAYWLTYFIYAILSVFFIAKFFNVKELLCEHFTYNPLTNLSLNGILFFVVTFWIGIGIFSVDHGIKTLWVNNFGDLPMHLGLIMNYVYGEVPLKDYHIFPGEYLSYSVLVDFWSALLLSLYPGLRVLQFIFIFQWSLIWLFSFISLSRNGHKIFPWVVLLSGGTWVQFLANIDLFHLTEGLKGYSHLLIEKGFPVTDLLTSIWIPQRTSLYGLFTLTVGMSAFSEYFLKRKRDERNYRVQSKILFQIGALLAISFLANFHMALVGLLIIGMYVAVKLAMEFKIEKRFVKPFISFVIPALIFTAIAYLQYAGKASMIKFVSGWMIKPESDFLMHFVQLWISNITFLILPITYFLFRIPRKLSGILIFIFILGNFISLSDWPWDNYKLFIGLFVSLLISAGSRYRPRESVALLLFISIAPGIYEACKVFILDKEQYIYSDIDVFRAGELQVNTPKNAIIAGKPSHVSPITLAGRKIYYGYPGWLGSHNIDEGSRGAINSNAQELLKCKETHQNCPDFVMVGLISKDDLENMGFLKTALPYLYKVP